MQAAAAFAWMASDPIATGNGRATISTDVVGRLEQELLSVYGSSSWRLTSPLRAAAEVVRRIGARSRAAKS